MTLEEEILSTFLVIARQSVDFVKEWRNGTKDVLSKINVNGQVDVVTLLDRQIEENAKNILSLKFQDFEFIGEEGFSGNCESFNHSYFVMDPIDGTKPFVEGSGDWSISLCFVIDGVPYVGMLAIPDKSIIITSIKGQGLKLNNQLIKVDRLPLNSIIGVSPRQTGKFNKTLINSMYLPKPMSALTPKIGAIINNEVDCAIYYPEDGKSASIWDYAAANFLISEGGGVMKSISGENLPYKGTGVIHKNGWIAAKNVTIYNKIKSYVDGEL